MSRSEGRNMENGAEKLLVVAGAALAVILALMAIFVG
jgi:hypothetical protein